MRLRLSIPLAALILAGCATQPPRPPAKAPPPPPPPAQPEVPETEWADLPLTPGTWSYGPEAGGSIARFGAPGAVPALTIRCETATRTIRIARAGASAGPMTIKTSYMEQAVPVTAGTDGTGSAITTVSRFAAADTLLDRVAFSRGRVSFGLPGLPLLVTPAWAEPARVIEDCRS